MKLHHLKNFFARLFEDTSPQWDTSVHRTVPDSDAPETALPASLDDADVLQVADVRSAGVILNPTDSGAVYGVTVYGWYASEEAGMSGFYMLDSGTWEDLSGKTSLGINCRLFEGLYVTVDTLNAGSLDVEVFAVPYRGE